MPSSIDKELVERVAGLARLNLTKKETKEFTKELKDILEAFKEIDKAKVGKTKPSFQPLELSNCTREDKKGECLSQEEALSNTKNKEKGQFKGPKVV